MIGVCKYCEQTIAADGAQTQEEADRYASAHCNCSASDRARRREEQIEAAKGNVRLLFGEESKTVGFNNFVSESIIAYFDKLVEIIANETFESVKINMGIYGTAQISLTAKGEIRVQRSQGHSIKTEV